MRDVPDRRRSMKKIGKFIYKIIGFLALLVLAWSFIYTFMIVKASGEAEVVAPIVRSMADQLGAFIEMKDRRPDSLNEIERFSGLKFEEIKKFKYRFYAEGPLLFHITVNNRHGFSIDQSYETEWTGAEPSTKPDTEPDDAENGGKPLGGERKP